MRVALIWASFGAYHLARLEAAGGLLAGTGDDLVGIEVAGTNRLYAWNRLAGARAFRRLTLREGCDYQDLSSRVIRREIRQTLDTVDPDIVAVPGWRAPEAHAAAAWGLRQGAGIVLMSESNAHDSRRYRHAELIKRGIVRACDAGFVGGQSHAAYLEQLGMQPDRIFRGYDAVDNAYFASAADRVRQSAAQVRAAEGLPLHFFLTCCRFVPVKNLLCLLDAYGQYRREVRTPWGLVVCGDGEQREALQRHARAKGIDGVIWPGFVQLDRLPRFYGLAGAFVLPSLVEPWGLVVNEAMASGLPVLVSRRCGSAELVESGRNGFLFDPENVGELAAHLAGMGEGRHDLTAFGEASRQRIRQWAPDAFAQGLRAAMHAAHGRSVRQPRGLAYQVAAWVIG